MFTSDILNETFSLLLAIWADVLLHLSTILETIIVGCYQPVFLREAGIIICANPGLVDIGDTWHRPFP